MKKEKSMIKRKKTKMMKEKSNIKRKKKKKKENKKEREHERARCNSSPGGRAEEQRRSPSWSQRGLLIDSSRPEPGEVNTTSFITSLVKGGSERYSESRGHSSRWIARRVNARP